MYVIVAGSCADIVFEQHFMHLLYITRSSTFKYAFRRTSSLSRGSGEVVQKALALSNYFNEYEFHNATTIWARYSQRLYTASRLRNMKEMPIIFDKFVRIFSDLKMCELYMVRGRQQSVVYSYCKFWQFACALLYDTWAWLGNDR